MNHPALAFVFPMGAAVLMGQSAEPRPASPRAVPIHDPREVGRLVASVLLASSPMTQEVHARADRALARLGAPPLCERDFVVTTPEELAPLIPLALRDALADILIELSADEPLRRRVALSYLGLWRLRAPLPTAKPLAPVTERIVRSVIGDLPRHQGVPIPQERIVHQGAVYRNTDEEARRAPPVVDPLRARVARIRAEMLGVIAAVDRVIIGKHDAVSRVLTAMAARGHVLLVDAPGVGKTQLCKAIAGAIGARFGRVQFTPDLLPMDVTGGTIYDPHKNQFVFRPGPVFTQILLADEINRATPKTQSALLEVMEERTVTVDGTTHAMPEPFQVLATMNPQDHDGTFPLPAAQIDRFMVMVELGYPTPEDEVRVLDTHLAPDPSRVTIAPVISGEAFLAWQATVPLIHASPEVKRAAVDFVNGLRRGATMGHTVSPRATLAWMRAAQARAMLAGREFVTVDDLLDMAPNVLCHRLWVSAPEVRDRLRSLMPRVAGIQR